MAPSDEVLLAQYRQGDARAFRALVERYTEPIYSLAYRLLRDPMEAENVAQEAFLRVVISLDRVRLDSPFKPYLFRIALNLCRDVGRKKHPVLFTDLSTAAAHGGRSDFEDASEALPDDGPLPWELLEEEELRRQLHAAIDNLPAHYQAVITLRYVEDLSYEEIAQTLNVPLNTVRTHLRRAKQQLRSSLEREARPVASNAFTQPRAFEGRQ